MDKAKAWVKEHEGKTARELSQEQVMDELDYTLKVIQETGLSENSKDKALELVTDILNRFSANDIAVDIRERLLSMLGPTIEEKESLKLIAIRDIARHRMADEKAQEEEEKQEISAVHRIVEQMFVDLAETEKKAEKDTFMQIVKSKLTEV